MKVLRILTLAVLFAAPSVATTADEAADLAYAAEKITIADLDCDAVPNLLYPRWIGFPVTLCRYHDVGATVETYFLNADRAKVARWTVTACNDAGAANMNACIRWLAGEMRNAATGNIFPVAGYVPEPGGASGRCYLFRDGVTINTDTYTWPPPVDGTCRPDAPNEDVDQTTAPAIWAGKYGRIASTTRPDYEAAGGSEDTEGVKWLDAVRELYQAAWTSNRNELISAVAKRGKRNGAFN